MSQLKILVTGNPAIDPRFCWAPAYVQYIRDGQVEEWLIAVLLSDNAEDELRARLAKFHPGCTLIGWRWRAQLEIDAQSFHRGNFL